MTAIGYSGTHGAGADRGVPLPVLRVLLKSEGVCIVYSFTVYILRWGRSARPS